MATAASHPEQLTEVGARIAVGVVLLVAGVAKLCQPSWPATARAFGAPAWLVPVLPWGEVVLGALLVSGVGLPWTALVGAALLAVFAVAVAIRVRRGDAVPCGCFGETSPVPVGADTVLRNLLLVVLAVMAAADRGQHDGLRSAVLGAAGGLIIVAESRLRTGLRRPG
ncbi:MAG TPA: MauE/DoxX family redox-associated membrane protein [Acidimicrobiales bacterium]|nr:MauE/DoxX family redox-associated membrane protein [Acidimicrobiales bacterium]